MSGLNGSSLAMEAAIRMRPCFGYPDEAVIKDGESWQKCQRHFGLPKQISNQSDENSLKGLSRPSITLISGHIAQQGKSSLIFRAFKRSDSRLDRSQIQ